MLMIAMIHNNEGVTEDCADLLLFFPTILFPARLTPQQSQDRAQANDFGKHQASLLDIAEAGFLEGGEKLVEILRLLNAAPNPTVRPVLTAAPTVAKSGAFQGENS